MCTASKKHSRILLRPIFEEQKLHFNLPLSENLDLKQSRNMRNVKNNYFESVQVVFLVLQLWFLLGLEISVAVAWNRIDPVHRKDRAAARIEQTRHFFGHKIGFLEKGSFKNYLQFGQCGTLLRASFLALTHSFMFCFCFLLVTKCFQMTQKRQPLALSSILPKKGIQWVWSAVEVEAFGLCLIYELSEAYRK